MEIGMESLGLLAAAGLVELLVVLLIWRYFGRLRSLFAKVTEDGEVTLDEVMEVIDEVQDIVEEVASLPSIGAMKKMRKDELMALAEERGVDVEGTKAEIIERLMG